MITHMYGKDISIDISAQREHDVNTWRQDRRFMYGVDLMPKRVSMFDIMAVQIRRQWHDNDTGIFSRDDLPDYNYT